LLHTFETTIQCKGVSLTQRNLAASMQNICVVYLFVVTDARVVKLPLFHVHGLMCVVLSFLAFDVDVTGDLPRREGAQHNDAGAILRILVDDDGHRREQVKRREGAETSAPENSAWWLGYVPRHTVRRIHGGDVYSGHLAENIHHDVNFYITK
jgi:acyl-CoA synthetase (AMP-forming)/AMP-acid ligase II